MPESRSGRAHAAQPAKAVALTRGPLQNRLVALLAEMVPGARTIRVSQRQPGQNWPSPYARAYDSRGQLIALNRAQRMTAARWVIRAHPELSWDEAHDIDLVNGALRPATDAYAVAGRGR
ncbi:hypothetical protein [Streptomyces nigrescens]|uniref:Uncharacterized protein n=1 Tax=Streptomyces nigrescens TaxID=1920 RepID=A0A640TP32_STRNI|nr:hypothetical protein [Streptomyces libani]WAU00052.1 hypothetical protein STRLI_006267 [Streptomyces libani subsp. libani]GFE25733.1 hypothetical protein Sliba_61860 [Streptomyces libani subsp. libani]GGV98886.1 hypothetical protein GCM10010500_48610 [Streptomyces libani subsp. libani]